MRRKNIKIFAAILAVAIIFWCVFALSACDGKGGVETRSPFDETRVYVPDLAGTDIMGNSNVKLAMGLLLDGEESYIEFASDGKARGKLQTIALDIGSLLDQFGDRFGVSRDSISARLKNVDIASMLNTNVEPMFPGFTDCIVAGDLDGALELVQKTVGLNISGIDFAGEDVKEAVRKMGEEYENSGGRNMHLPSNLLDLIPAGARLALTVDWDYEFVRLVGNDGVSHEAVYIGGSVVHNHSTQPFAVFSMYTDSDGSQKMALRIEFLNTEFALKLKTE